MLVKKFNSTLNSPHQQRAKCHRKKQHYKHTKTSATRQKAKAARSATDQFLAHYNAIMGNYGDSTTWLRTCCFFLTAKHTFFLVQYLCCRQSWKIKAHVLLHVLLSVCTYLSFDWKPSKRMRQCRIEMYPIKWITISSTRGFATSLPQRGRGR